MIALIFIFLISLTFALECPFTKSLNELDDLEFIKSYKHLGYPLWVKSENRERVISQYKERFANETQSNEINLAADYSTRLVKAAGILI